MNERHEKIYLLMLAQQLEFAALAHDELREAARYYLLDDVMRRAQAFLGHTISASRVLWPVKGKKAEAKERQRRGEHLRKILGISDAHSLFKEAQRARNFLEHMDEKLDVLLGELGDQPLVWQGLNNREIHSTTVRDSPDKANADGTPDTQRTTLALRDYDPRSDVVQILGDEFDLAATRRSVQQVGTAVYRLLNERFFAGGGLRANMLADFPDHARLLLMRNLETST